MLVGGDDFPFVALESLPEARHLNAVRLHAVRADVGQSRSYLIVWGWIF